MVGASGPCFWTRFLCCLFLLPSSLIYWEAGSSPRGEEGLFGANSTLSYCQGLPEELGEGIAVILVSGAAELLPTLQSSSLGALLSRVTCSCTELLQPVPSGEERWEVSVQAAPQGGPLPAAGQLEGWMKASPLSGTCWTLAPPSRRRFFSPNL